MRFVDDVEFFSVAEEQVIHVRSASRLGRLIWVPIVVGWKDCALSCWEASDGSF